MRDGSHIAGQSTLDKALTDTCGIHMNAGCFSAMYTRSDVSDDLPMPPEDLKVLTNHLA